MPKHGSESDAVLHWKSRFETQEDKEAPDQKPALTKQMSPKHDGDADVPDPQDSDEERPNVLVDVEDIDVGIVKSASELSSAARKRESSKLASARGLALHDLGIDDANPEEEKKMNLDDFLNDLE